VGCRGRVQSRGSASSFKNSNGQGSIKKRGAVRDAVRTNSEVKHQCVLTAGVRGEDLKKIRGRDRGIATPKGRQISVSLGGKIRFGDCCKVNVLGLVGCRVNQGCAVFF